MTNRRRAEAAAAALNAFTEETYGGRGLDQLPPGDIFTAAYDLVADLGHLIRRVGEQHPGSCEVGGFDEMLRLASFHYDAEAGLDWDEDE